MKEPIFCGVATAIVTPFIHNEIDSRAVERILDTQVEAGVQAVVVTGTTGEASTMSIAEKSALWRFVCDYLGGRIKVIAGVGTNDTAASVYQSKIAQECGADALLAVTPYYNKCSQDGLVAHYTAIADATELPLIAYNVPSRTGVNLLPQTCKRLSDHPNIAGVKEASGNISQISEILSLCSQFPLWSGNDDQIVPIMSMGGLGVISVLSNICPKAVVEIAEACLNQDYHFAAKMQLHYLPLIKALFSDVNPIPVKEAMCQMGICSRELRLPLTPLSVQKRLLLSEAMNMCI